MNLKYGQSIDGTMDTTLGLIMRLNKLWIDCDNHALSGDYQKWNFTLDAIWRNLLYRDDLQTEKNEKGEIDQVMLSEDDQKLWHKLNLSVVESQKELKEARRSASREKFDIAMEKCYKALQMKDVGMRKFQHKLRLYVKERSKNPSNAMWGG